MGQWHWSDCSWNNFGHLMFSFPSRYLLNAVCKGDNINPQLFRVFENPNFYFASISSLPLPVIFTENSLCWVMLAEQQTDETSSPSEEFSNLRRTKKNVNILPMPLISYHSSILEHRHPQDKELSNSIMPGWTVFLFIHCVHQCAWRASFNSHCIT